MKLEVKERVILTQLLPTETDYLTYKIVQDLRNDLGFSEKEIKDFEIRTENGQLFWNPQKAKTKEVEIGDTGMKIIAEALEELNKQKKINTDNVSLYEKFVLK